MLKLFKSLGPSTVALLRGYFMLAFRSLAMVSHCIDDSDWPMTVAEFSENFQLFVAPWPFGHRLI